MDKDDSMELPRGGKVIGCGGGEYRRDKVVKEGDLIFDVLWNCTPKTYVIC